MAAFDHIIGSVLDGKYEVQRLVARGGMGEVYAGAHLQLERPVAIKVLHGDLSDKEAFVNRFAREARTAARLEHPNAVHIYDFGALEDGSTYLVMEYIEGVTLREVIRRNGRFSLGTALGMLRQAAAAVGAAHARGIVHRDLKPENMMVRLDESGRVVLKVVDFGLAKMLENQTSQVTNKSELIGTPKYMAPEQFSGDRIDERVDVYALGCVFFEMLAGRTPYEGTMMEIVGKHVHAEVPRLASVDVEVPEAIEAAVRHALEKNPVTRTASAADLVREIEAACGDLPAESEPIVIPPPPPAGVTIGHTPSEVPTRRGPTTPAFGEKALETRYAEGEGDQATHLRDAKPPTVIVPVESGEVSAAETKAMPEIRKTMAELPASRARGSRVLRIAAGTAAVLALSATGFWAFRQQTPEPAPPVQSNSIEVTPAPPAPAEPEPEPVAAPPAEAPQEAPKPSARASKARTERKTDTRAEVVVDPDIPEIDLGLDEEEFRKLATPPPGLSPQERREYIRAMRKLRNQRALQDARRRKRATQVQPVKPTPPAPEAP